MRCTQLLSLPAWLQRTLRQPLSFHSLTESYKQSILLKWLPPLGNAVLSNEYCIKPSKLSVDSERFHIKKGQSRLMETLTTVPLIAHHHHLLYIASCYSTQQFLNYWLAFSLTSYPSISPLMNELLGYIYLNLRWLTTFTNQDIFPFYLTYCPLH